MSSATNLAALFPPYDPSDPSWCSRRIAAQRLNCSERDLDNRVEKGTLHRERVSKGKWKYYVPIKFYPPPERTPPLPIETYDEDHCFIAWITFSKSSRTGERFEVWIRDMHEWINNYVAQKIRPDINDATFVMPLGRAHEHHDVPQQDPIIKFVIRRPALKTLQINDRS